jgi:cytidylate kinase
MAREPQTFTTTIDGPAGAGKSTVGERLARRLSATFFDTGVLYRTVTLVALREAIAPNDAARLTAIAEVLDIHIRPPSVDDGRQSDVLLSGDDVSWAIRTPEVDRTVSEVSAHASVRQALLPLQRRIGRSGWVVMVGRDIGTVVMPDADLKIFLDASLDERARRRCRQLQEAGRPADVETVLAQMRERDEFDSGRAVSPLRQAEDAVVIDSAGRTIDAVVDEIASLVGDRVSQLTAPKVRG